MVVNELQRKTAIRFQEMPSPKHCWELERFGPAEEVGSGCNLINLVGAWGFEPQTPTVSR